MTPPFVHQLRVRYHECDAQGIVFNAHHFAYFDVTLTELWREAFGSYDAWEMWVERLGRLGLLVDYTRLWWDIRPHPRLGTLEVRMPDQPTSLERTALLVGLVRRLVEAAPPREADPARRGDYAQNRWAAARFGLDAELVHPDGDRAATARDLAEELLGAESPEPEAARQLEVGADHAAADLVARTVG